ncbi:MAG TPA: TAXI family TRAP transporter solute-binding subunit [Thermoanaerobaculia bacterium]|nr:TAXI family TRAP transporter solute-binding subunit [Thermoanaerobaculia bacterium]
MTQTPSLFRPSSRARASAVAWCLLLAPILGCGGGDGDARAGKQFLSLGTAPPGGAFFVVGGALAEVLNQHGAGSWEVTAEATKGSKENIRRLDRGEIDLALSNAAITYFAVRGERDWEKPYPILSVMTLAPNVALFIAPRSSGVAAIADLRGKRVVTGPAGAGFEDFLEPLLAAHGIGYADFTPLNATQAGAVDLLADGAAAAAFIGGAIPTASITQAATSQDIVYVPFDPAAVEALVRDYPFFEPATIPAGTYRGLDRDYQGLDVGSMHLVTAASVPEDLIYEVTKTLWENREAVVERHPAGRAINPRVAVRDAGTEFHPGAIRFYREIGIWPDPEAGAADAEAEADGAGRP